MDLREGHGFLNSSLIYQIPILAMLPATLGKFLKIRYPKIFSYWNFLNKILLGIFSINLFGIFGFEKFT